MCNSDKHNKRPARESLSKRLGKRGDAIKLRDAGRCVYCTRNEEESGAHMQLDHLIPKAEGGEDVETNLVVACRRCNSARQKLSVGAWEFVARAQYGIAFDTRAVFAQAQRALPSVKRAK